MTVDALVEVTAQPGQLGEIREAARTFLDEAQETEARLEQAEAYVIEGKRTLLVHLVFEDALAAQEHRSKTHTVRFTEEIEEACETLDVHQLRPLSLSDD